MKLRLVLIIIVLALSPQASAIDFTPYYGRNEAIEGQGGAMKVIEGVDFWTNGTPPRRYKIIGFIEDTRKITGMIGKARLKSLPAQIAKMAKEHDGDAVIAVTAEDSNAGLATNGHVATVVVERTSKFAVIKYVE